ncbi:MAG: DNA polymerase III subunit delta [Negativicutes bacterium]|nr:DNA polymerase III subunit delta [Negativicutes bacterium]
MEYSDIINEIKKGRIRPVYLLHGEETYLMRKLERAIIDAVLTPEERETGLFILENDPDPSYLTSLIETAPFFGGRNVVVLRETALFKARKGTSEAETGDSQEKEDDGTNRLLGIIARIPDYSLVIFSVSGKADKRRKLYKIIEQQGAVVEISPPKAKDARQWVVEKLEELGKRMNPDAMEQFLGLLSMMPKISVSIIHNELEKVALYVGANKTIARDDLAAVMASAPEVNIFEMTEALSRKEIKPAIELLQSQLSAGEYPVKLLGLLAFHIRRLWQVKELATGGMNAKDIADALKIHSFIAERLLRQSRGFSADKLKQALLQLAGADRGLKSGRASSITLEKIMIDLCSRES